MKNIHYYLMPHPPIMIPEVGKGEERKIINTTKACLQVAKEIASIKPDTIVVITPHGPMFQDAVAISLEESISGSLKQFNASSVQIEKTIDQELTKEIIKKATEANISYIPINHQILRRYYRAFELDHGTIVPLYYIEKAYPNYQLVHITYGLIKDIDLFRFGVIIKEAINELGRKAVVIASGDLSHRLTKDGTYPYSPKGKVFDDTLMRLLEKGDPVEVLKISKNLSEEAGECGLRSVFVMLGSINSSFKGEVLSYEGPFGVGYGVVKLTPTDSDENILKNLIIAAREKFKKKDISSNPYIKLARASIEYYLKTRKSLLIPSDTPEELLTKQAGVFVSLKKFGRLRGCIGTFLPTTENIASEIINNAISAAVRDPRFSPVKIDELADIDISVDVLSEPTSATIDELDPKVYGVIVSKGFKKGLLLPNLEGVDTVSEQLAIACEKAGINPSSNYHIEKFTVTRYYEGDKYE